MGQKLLIKTRVARIIDETLLIKRFVLTPVVRSAFPIAAPGDHVIVLLPNGLRRSYSLCSDTADMLPLGDCRVARRCGTWRFEAPAPGPSVRAIFCS